MKNATLHSLSLALMLAIGVPLSAQGQEGATASIEEVIVTAARREQSLQSLEKSATVFSGEDLNALGVLQPRDLAEQTPGLLTKYGPNGLATVGF